MGLWLLSFGNDKTKTIESKLDTASTFDVSITTVSTLIQPALSHNFMKSNAILSQSNVGQCPTPSNQVLTMNESLYEDGYDSDGQIGPFYDSIFGMEAVKFHEDTIRSEDLMPETKTGVNVTASQNGSENHKDKFTMTDVEIMALRKSDLVEQCKLLGLDKRGNKDPLQQRLKKARDDGMCYLSSDQMNNPEAEQLGKDGFSPLARWEYLEDKDESLDLKDELEVDGIKYRSPTIPREEFERTGVGNGGKEKFNFIRTIQRKQFIKKALLPKKDSKGRVMKDRKTGEWIYTLQEVKKSVPNMKFIKKHRLSYKAEPFEWFNAFIPFKKSRSESNQDGSWTIGEWTRNTNLKAMLSNAGSGGTIYKDFTPFTTFELMKHVGLYFLNGVSPSPRVEMKLKPQAMDPFNGNDMVFNSMGSNAERRHRHFKCFFAIQDPRIATPSRKSHPNWKVEPLLKQALRVSKDAVIPGQDAAIDEQTNGFQGAHEDKKRISEKREGDGFQSDSVNVEGGYTWAFYFRNQPPPPKWINQGLCPLHCRVMSLIEQLGTNHHCIYMDNLYMSAKLCLAAWKHHKAMLHGVCRQGGRGIPDKLKQETRTKQDEEFNARGTLIAAVCDGDPEMTPIICTSLYDVKPFYMMSTVASEVVWTRKFMNIFCATDRKKVQIPFYQLNLANMYNNKIGRVDVGDQLRNSYQFDHWMQK